MGKLLFFLLVGYLDLTKVYAVFGDVKSKGEDNLFPQFGYIGTVHLDGRRILQNSNKLVGVDTNKESRPDTVGTIVGTRIRTILKEVQQ